MGIIKEKMIEAESYDWQETTANFTCPECGELSDGNIEVPTVRKDIDDDVAVDIDVQCTFCAKRFNTHFSKSINGLDIKFHEYPETLVEFNPIYYEDYDPDEWIDDHGEWMLGPYFYDQPKEPYTVYKDAYNELMESINLHGSSDGNASMNRMFFSQSFTIFEAYLCDSFLNLVFFCPDHQDLFIQQHREIKKISFSLSDMMGHDKLTAAEIVKKEITQIIKKTLFHDLGMATAMFHIYKVKLFSENEGKELLFKAVKYRHHAIHRNGCDLEGNVLDVYSKDYIVQVSEAMMKSAKLIDSDIKSFF